MEIKEILRSLPVSTHKIMDEEDLKEYLKDLKQSLEIEKLSLSKSKIEFEKNINMCEGAIQVLEYLNNVYMDFGEVKTKGKYR